MQDASRGRVLVIDDDADVRALLTRNLEIEGYEVHQSADAQGPVMLAPTTAWRCWPRGCRST